MQIDTAQAAAMLQKGFRMRLGAEVYWADNGRLCGHVPGWRVDHNRSLPWSNTWTVHLDEEDMSAQEARWFCEHEPGAFVADLSTGLVYKWRGGEIQRMLRGGDLWFS